MKQCQKCGSETKYRTGVKNGKKWEAYFCQNTQCKDPNWVRQGSGQQNASQPQNTPNNSIPAEDTGTIMDAIVGLSNKIDNLARIIEDSQEKKSPLGL